MPLLQKRRNHLACEGENTGGLSGELSGVRISEANEPDEGTTRIGGYTEPHEAVSLSP